MFSILIISMTSRIYFIKHGPEEEIKMNVTKQLGIQHATIVFVFHLGWAIVNHILCLLAMKAFLKIIPFSHILPVVISVFDDGYSNGDEVES
jgi:hypothetical protein